MFFILGVNIFNIYFLTWEQDVKQRGPFHAAYSSSQDIGLSDYFVAQLVKGRNGQKPIHISLVENPRPLGFTVQHNKYGTIYRALISRFRYINVFLVQCFNDISRLQPARV